MDKEKEVRKLNSKEIPHFKLQIAGSFIILSIIQIAGLIPALIMQRIIDDYIPDKNIHNILLSILWFTAIPIITTSMNTIHNYYINIIGRRAGKLISLRAYQNLLSRPVKFYDDNNSSELASYCGKEANQYIVFWMFEMPELFSGILLGALVYLLLIRVNVYLAIGLLLYIPVLLLPSNFFANKVNDIGTREHTMSSKRGTNCLYKPKKRR